MSTSHRTAIRSISSPLAITAFYYAGFIGLGMVTAVTGPTLGGLAEQTGVQLKQISVVFSASALGYLLGALFSGRLFDRRRGHPVMAGGLLMVSVMMALVPTMPKLAWLAGAILLVGFFQAFLDVGGNTLLVWLHREKVSPYMNGLHFFFGIGAVLSPLLVAQVTQAGLPFGWVYWIISLLLLPVAVLLYLSPSPTAPHKEAGAAPQARTNWLLAGLFVLFFMTFVGSEGAYGGWIHSYAVKTHIATPVTAAYLTSIYWGAFTLSRLVSIPLALRLRPFTLLVIDLVGCFIGLGLAVFGGGSLTMIVLATIIFGASNATLFPVSMSFAGETITVTGQFVGMIFVGASLGGMIVPWLIGQFIESAGAQSVMVILLFDMLVSAGIFVILNLVRKRSRE